MTTLPMKHSCSSLAVAMSLFLAAGTPASGQDVFRVRTIAMPRTAYATSIVVETSAHVVVIDAGFSEADAKKIDATIRETGKPMAALLLTHGHIDHYGGAYFFRDLGVPILTGRGVVRQLDEYGEVNRARFGLPAPSVPLRPRVFGDGEELVVDGVTFTLHDLGPGESYSDVWWSVSSPTMHAAVIGDVAMYGIPPLMQSGRSLEWLGSLDALQKAIPGDWSVYIGHDSRAVGDPDRAWTVDILSIQSRWISAFRDVVEELTAGTRLLETAEVDEVVARMHEVAPENDEGFDFLIKTSANILAAELIEENTKATFERALQTLFRPRGD